MCGAFLLELLQLIFYYILLLTDHVSIGDNNNVHMRNINIYKFVCLNNV
jgi:hypothetical protein